MPAANRRVAEARGRRAEAAAALMLRLKGYRIVERRFRSPQGEIDLIVRRGHMLAFVEVKARTRENDAADAIVQRQRMRIAAAARVFLQRRGDLADLDMRFDAVLVSPGRLPHHIPDAWRL